MTRAHSAPTATKPSTANSPPSSDAFREREMLESLLRDEVGDQAWQFDTERVSRMLSPKRLKPGGDHRFLDNYDCDVDKIFFKDALTRAKLDLRETLSEQSLNWPLDKAGELQYSQPLAQFMNVCLKACHVALDSDILAPASNLRWYHDLDFIGYGRPTGDDTDAAHPLKLDLAGGKKLVEIFKQDPSATLCWSPVDKSHHRIDIPVVVHLDENDMVVQAALYARSLFSASPSRLFSLVLCFNQMDKALRFLIFHRGGLTASLPLYLETQEGREGALELFLSVACWTSAADAGFNPSCNDLEYMVPLDSTGTQGVRAAIVANLHEAIRVRGSATKVSRVLVKGVPTQPSSKQTNTPHCKTATTAEGTPSECTTRNEKMIQIESCPITPYKRENDIQYFEPRGFASSHETQALRKEFQKPAIAKVSWQKDETKDIEPGMYTASNGRFGTVSHLCSYEGTYEDGRPISNHLFLPRKDEIGTVFWALFERDMPPTGAETRTLCYSFFSLEGRSLEEAESSRELCEGLIHGVLGWFSIYQAGYLHQDISIGNLLLCLNPVEKSGFEIAAEFRKTARESVHELASRFESLVITSLLPSASELEEQITRVERLVRELGVSTRCVAFVTDGDRAIHWPSYFEDHDSVRKEKSGTSEFMSPELLLSTEYNSDYLQSPVDDLFSVYWVALWAILNNIHTSGRSDSELRWRTLIAEGQLKRAYASLSICRLVETRKRLCSPIVQQWSPVLNSWFQSLDRLDQDWKHQEDLIRSYSLNPNDLPGHVFLPLFHYFTLRGVADFLEMIKPHYIQLCTCLPFVT